LKKYLGCRLTEQIVLNDGTEAAMWMTMSNKSYGLCLFTRSLQYARRFHHVTYALDSREDVLRAADFPGERRLYRDRPAQAAIHRRPLRLRARWQRVEVANAGARLILGAGLEAIVWTEDERKKGQAWGLRRSSRSTPTAPPTGCNRQGLISGRCSLRASCPLSFPLQKLPRCYASITHPPAPSSFQLVRFSSLLFAKRPAKCIFDPKCAGGT